MEHVATGYAALKGVAGKHVGNDFAGSLLDNLAIMKQWKFHSFRIAVNGLAVRAVKRVEFLRVSLEIYGVVCQPSLGKKGFDDLAAYAVWRRIKGYAHVSPPVTKRSNADVKNSCHEEWLGNVFKRLATRARAPNGHNNGRDDAQQAKNVKHSVKAVCCIDNRNERL